MKSRIGITYILVFACLMGMTLSVAGEIHPGTYGKVENNYSIGQSSLSVNSTHVSINIGGSATLSYTLKLTSGSAWGTNMEYKGTSTITVSFSSSGGDPTYSGTATFTASSSAKAGTYNITLFATGDDPTSSNLNVTVTVINKVSTSPPPPTSSTNYDPYIVGGVVIALFVVLAVLLSTTKSDSMKFVMVGSTIISLASSLYLLMFDSVLRVSGYDHWLGLIAFFILTIIALVISLTKSKANRLAYLGMAAGNALMGLLMISDALLGLPVSSYYNTTSNIGWKYLFGFGTTSISSAGISIAFSLILIMAGAIIGSSLSMYKNKLSTS